LLNLVIFVVLFALGFYFFSEGGPFGAFFAVSEQVLGMSIVAEGGSAAMSILSFIISAAVYYFVATVIAALLTALFGKRE